MSQAFLSIITVNRNNKEGLRKTLESVLCQQGLAADSLEYIVIDGDSSDGSLALLQDYAERSTFPQHISWWCSEADSGIYNAMNKGLAHATGKYVLFLNSGDYLASPTILRQVWGEEIAVDIAYFDVILYYPDRTKLLIFPDEITPQFYVAGRSLNHQCCLIRTSLQKKYPYDESFRMVSDSDFFIKTIIRDGCSYRHYRFPLSYYEAAEGFSSNPVTRRLRDEEWQVLLRRYFSDAVLQDIRELLDFKYGYLGILRKARKLFSMLRSHHKQKSPSSGSV